MGYWVVTVAGMAILSVLCDVILPEGQTRKYVKTVFGIVVSLVIIQPIVGMFGGNTLFQFTSNSSMDVQNSYLNSVGDRRKNNAIQNFTTILSKNGIDVQLVDVDDTDKKILVQLNVAYSENNETVIKHVANVYFGGYDVETIWAYG